MPRISKNIKLTPANEKPAPPPPMMPNKPLDIKAQLRLVRDRCPDVWNAFFVDRCPRIITNNYSMDCPQRQAEESCDRYFTGFTPSLIIRCWDKALEGDE